MYYLYIILREECPYSKNLVKLLKEYKIDFDSITVSIEDKEKYKTDLIKTFPQVYLKSLSNNDSILIGGFDITKELIENIKNDKKFDILTKNFSDKIKLKLKLILKGHKIINII
jgi:glutaredoxin-related protein